MKRYFFIVIFFCWPTITMATITMQIEPTTARPGETIHLTLTHNDPHSHDVPDLTPLKTEFSVLGTEHSMTYTANNGIAKSENQWVILLVPKKLGTLTIPPIRIGHQYSQPGQVTITTTPSPIEENQDEPLDDENNVVTLHTEIDQKEPFINQQIIYTVKLSTNQSLLEAQYQPPQVENALLIPLGDSRRYQTTIDGQEYSIDEQRYAIYPQKSGVLTITPPKLTAVVYDTLPERIQVEGNAVQLMVKPKPATVTQSWLPAKQLVLSEEYDSTQPTLQQGSTLVRKITLRAVGLPAELLPILTFPDDKQYNVYPEKPDTSNALRQQELIGTSVITVTYILNQSGQITLPSITLPWFNTQTQHEETATLPSHHIEVAATSSPAAVLPASNIFTEQPTTKKSSPLVQTQTNSSHQLAWWIATGFALAWITTLGLWWAFHHRPLRQKKSNKPSARTQLHQACATNDPQKTLPALLNWGRAQWPENTILNLNDLSLLVHHVKLQQQINLLSEALYARNSASIWQGDALWQAIKDYRLPASTKKTKSNPLPPINPDIHHFK